MKDMMHLARITAAQLGGSINPSEDEIIAAMHKAVAKEAAMGNQLLDSYYTGDRKLFDAFAHEMASMVYEAARK